MGRILPGDFKQRSSNSGTLPRKVVTIGGDLLMASWVNPDPKVGTVITFVTASNSSPPSPASGAPPGSDSSQLPIRSGGGAEKANFTFRPRQPSQPFEFSSASPSHGSTSSKRERPLTDVDGPGTSHVHKKKRRLRLELVTSRLSSPYATPTTYAPDRGSSKIAVWARQKKTPRDVSIVRKAAILNRMQRRAMRSYERQWQVLHRTDEEDGEDHDDERVGDAPEVGNVAEPHGFSVESPNRNYHIDATLPRHCPAVPLPYHQPIAQQSFIGISNYDALDDDDFAECEDHRYEEEDDQGEGVPGPSSRPVIDFNNISTDDGTVVDDADFIESFGAFGPGPFDFGKHRGTTEGGSPTRKEMIPQHRAGPGVDPADDGDSGNQSSIPPLSLDTKDKGKRRQEDPGSPEEDLVGKLINMVGESERQRDRKGSLRSK